MTEIMTRPAFAFRRAWFIYSLVAFGFLGANPVIFAAGPGMKTLPGHVPAIVAHLSSKGNLPSTNHLNLAIGLPLRDEKGLNDYLAQLYDQADQASPNYRHYLTPEQFTEKFGPTEADYAKVIAFAQSNRLTVTAMHGNRLLLDVNGSVADIQRAFHIKLRTYRHPTEARDFYAPDAEPAVDAQLPVLDVSGLNNYTLPRPKSFRLDPATVTSNAAPKSGSGSGGAYIGNDFRAAYLPGVTLTGSGQMVGLVQFDGFYAGDISAYETAAGLPAVLLQTVLLDGYDGVPTTGPDSGNGEVSLDIEMTVSMAPGLAKIIVFEAGPNGLQNDILNAMAASNQVSQFSCSWGWGGGPSATTDNIFKQMASQGQSFFEASGDSDAFTSGEVDDPNQPHAPSSSPYITVVGGTTLTTTGPGGLWSSETVWNWGLHKGSYVGSSGGISSYYSIPSWQTAIDMSANGGSTSYRNIPDVALIADNVHVQYGNGTSGAFGGTSCAAPLWAGLAALINQQAASAGRAPVGFVNPAIYALGKSANYNSSFHDITAGNNTWPGSSNNFYAVSGYDLCTGWGTPAGQSLINALAGPPDSLGITPATGFAASGAVGGPFSPNSTSFLLTNSGAASLTWSLINLPPWLNGSPASGTLAPGGTTGVMVGLTATAGNLDVGTYPANIMFTNWNSHVAQNASFTLQVGQSLVQNGGFENGDFTGWTLTGDTAVFGPFGSTVYNAVENSASYPSVVHSGNYGAFLGDTQLASLSQTLATVSGQAYLLSFWLDNPTNGAVQRFLVNWIANGTSTNTLYDLASPPVLSWTNPRFIVTATSSGTVLQFGAENDPFGFGLDDISVTPIPAIAFQSVAKTNGAFSLTWRTARGLVYQVQYKTNLLQADWVNLGTPIIATNSSLTVSDTSATTSSPQRFYRLVASP